VYGVFPAPTQAARHVARPSHVEVVQVVNPAPSIRHPSDRHPSGRHKRTQSYDEHKWRRKDQVHTWLRTPGLTAEVPLDQAGAYRGMARTDSPPAGGQVIPAPAARVLSDLQPGEVRAGVRTRRALGLHGVRPRLRGASRRRLLTSLARSGEWQVRKIEHLLRRAEGRVAGMSQARSTPRGNAGRAPRQYACPAE
jgi:hypothetical protein